MQTDDVTARPEEECGNQIASIDKDKKEVEEKDEEEDDDEEWEMVWSP